MENAERCYLTRKLPLLKSIQRSSPTPGITRALLPLMMRGKLNARRVHAGRWACRHWKDVFTGEPSRIALG